MKNEHLYIISFFTCQEKEPELTPKNIARAPAQILNRLRLQPKTSAATGSGSATLLATYPLPFKLCDRGQRPSILAC